MNPNLSSESEALAVIGLMHLTSDSVAEESLKAVSSDISSAGESDDGDSIHETGTGPSQSRASRKRHASFKVKKNRSSLIAVQFAKGDARNTFAESYFEAVNSGNHQKILRMLQNSCSTNVQLVCKFDQAADNDYTPENLEVYGIDAMAAVLGEVVRSTPDAVLRIVTKQVEVYRNGESVVTVSWTFKGTKIFDIVGLKSGEKDKIVVASATGTSSSDVGVGSVSESVSQMQIVTSTTLRTEVNPATGKKTEVARTETLGTGVMREEARDLQFSGINAFYINKHRRVYLIVSNQQKEGKK